jgi:hypothetical protein
LPEPNGERERKNAMVPKGYVLIACGLVLASCSRQAQEKPVGMASSAAALPSRAPAAPPKPTAAARSVDEQNGEYEFEYSYPAEAASIPALKDVLEAELKKNRAELIAAAKEQRAMSKENGFDYNTVSAGTAWSVVTNLPGWLSLSAAGESYEGGAHPNHGYDALLWDRQANVRRKATDLFTSKAAFSQAVHQGFCAALDKQRAQKRQGEDVGDGIDEFNKCIDPAGTTVILGSSNHATFDRIGWLIGPYEAGPYAEGDYEITLPVTPAVLAAVKPEYRAAFSVKR